MTLQTVLVIGGPTASGKSGLALAVAERLSGVVINADSMQIYDGLPLLTAQPSPEDRRCVPHRLYASLSPDETCSAARWRDMALTEIEAARRENLLPVIVGGTGFYLKALLKGLSPVPDVPHGLRETVAARQKETGNPGFHKELEKCDPVMAARLHPFNTQRLIRAFEVLEATGKSLAEWQAQPPVPPPAHVRFLTVTLLPPRARLYQNCDTRFGQMLEKGALEEVRAFRQKHTSPTSLAHALGYHELAAYLDGALSLEEAGSEARAATRHYAKRQVTWFRHQLKADLTLETADSAALMVWVKNQ